MNANLRILISLGYSQAGIVQKAIRVSVAIIQIVNKIVTAWHGPGLGTTRSGSDTDNAARRTPLEWRIAIIYFHSAAHIK